jgi:predicted O-linked N-acetylglucosamine transferase (SPINDLY family)
MTTVSILIPAFKPDYLAKAIASAQAQSFADIEILVGDDTVDGRLRPIVESFDDPRIRYFHHASGDARRNSFLLFEQARGQYIKWLYDDDLLMPRSVEALVDALRQHPGSAIAVHERVLIDADDNVLHTPPPLVPAGQIALVERPALVEHMVALANNFIGEPSNIMMVRDAVDMSTVMLYRGWDITFLNDVSMYLNLAEKGPLVLLGGYLSCFRRHGTQNSGVASPILVAGYYEWEVMVRGEAAAGQMSAEALMRAKAQLTRLYTHGIDTLGMVELQPLRDNLDELVKQPTAGLYASPRFRADAAMANERMHARAAARLRTPGANVAAAEKPATTNPAVEALLARAVECHQADRLDEAETLYREILATDPNHPEALHLLGLVAHAFGQYATASELIMAAIAVRPAAAFYYNLGNVMQADNRPAAAVECFRQAIAQQPDYIDAYYNLGIAQRAMHDLTGAVDSFVKVVSLKPDHAQAYNNLATTMMELDELDAAIEAYSTAIALRPELPAPRSNRLFASNYYSGVTPAAYLEEAKGFDEAITQGVTPYRDWLVEATPATGRALRVGIVSGDLNQHAVGYLLESVANHVDAARVELHAYATRDVEDALTLRIRPHFATWTSLAGMTDDAAAARIRDDRIDVLIDASGHTQFNRLPVFARKPAPVQVSWPGYFASTGVRAIDYMLGDRHVMPESEAHHFTERAWRMPDSYLCFTPPAEQLDVGNLPMLDNGHVTFGYFGKLAKISDQTVMLWSRVLHAVAHSRLFIKAQNLDLGHARESIVARFAAHGVDASRLILEDRSPRAEYLAAYRRVDIGLSPFSYPGRTTTAEGMIMGVPVLCLRGERFLSHICESMLHAAGLPDWIAQSEDDYVAKATQFAADASQLQALRSGLRAQVVASPLCDAPRFAKHLEDALHGMWAAHVAATEAVAG